MNRTEQLRRETEMMASPGPVLRGPPAPPQQPGLGRRVATSVVMVLTGLASKGFIYGFNRVEVVGLDRFLALLDARRDVDKRERGLLTVSNHISVLDDPLMWGVLPLRYLLEPQNLRWGMGAHDICYKNKLLGTFFNVGQTLPMHRLHHSPLGGLFQPTVTQAIRLLSAPPYSSHSNAESPGSVVADDPFTSGALTYSTTGQDAWPAPSAYACNRHAWVHIFPEGGVHQQQPDPGSGQTESGRGLRYFKWGVARLVLEAEPAPDVVPLFVDGTDRVMPEDRAWPRFAPRPGQRVRVAFGEPVDFEATFGDLRRRWRALVEEARAPPKTDAKPTTKKRFLLFGSTTKPDTETESGTKPQSERLYTLGTIAEDEESLRHGAEAERIRAEVARRMRDEVLKLRRSLGYPDEDPSLRLGDAATWERDPHDKSRYRSRVDGSIVSQD